MNAVRVHWAGTEAEGEGEGEVESALDLEPEPKTTRPQKQQRPPRFASEFQVSVRKRFLFRVYLPFCVTLMVWLLCVQWATSDHLSPATWMNVDDLDAADADDHDAAASVLPRLAGHPVVLIVSAALLGIVLLAVSCVPHMTTWFPLNLLLWLLFTLSSGYLLASLASNYSRAMVVHSILLLLLIVVPLAIYCLLPCAGDYWHGMALLWVLVVVTVVGLVVILPHSNDYLANWGWLEHRDPIRSAPRHAYRAAQVWLTLAFVLVVGAYFVYCTRYTERHMEPDEWLAGSILLSMYLGMLFALSLEFVSSACRTSLACCVRGSKGGGGTSCCS